MRLPRVRPVRADRWPVWSLPGPVLVVILLVELLALTAVVAGAVAGIHPLPTGWSWTVAMLVGSGIVATEASLGVERVRRRSEQSPHIDLSSVWAFAAVCLLPGPLALVVAVAVYLHIYCRISRRTGVPLHRALFSTATVVLAVQAASAVIGTVGPPNTFRTSGGLFVVLLALLTYAAVNMVLVVAVIVLSGPHRDVPTFLQMLRHADDAILEFATLSMGTLVAGAMFSFGPAYAVLVLPPLIVLHRSVLVRQLEEEASTDSKTGLLNASAWHMRAGHALLQADRVETRATVLVLDLDHFKKVNDRYGHLIGDRVLHAIASTIRGEVRDEDLVGRFGGEEFVVLLQGVEGDNELVGARTVAERIRRRVASLRVEVPAHDEETVVVTGLSVSIGGASFPEDGLDVAGLLEVADSAMYAAKDAGRDRVLMGLPGPACVEPDRRAN